MVLSLRFRDCFTVPATAPSHLDGGLSTQHPAPSTQHPALSQVMGTFSSDWLFEILTGTWTEPLISFPSTDTHSSAASSRYSARRTQHPAPSHLNGGLSPQHPAPSTQQRGLSTQHLPACQPGEQHTLALQTPGQQLPHTQAACCRPPWTSA